MSETLAQGEQEAIDHSRAHFDAYCVKLQGYIPLRESPTEARIARAYLAWRAASAQQRQ